MRLRLSAGHRETLADLFHVLRPVAVGAVDPLAPAGYEGEEGAFGWGLAGADVDGLTCEELVVGGDFHATDLGGFDAVEGVGLCELG